MEHLEGIDEGILSGGGGSGHTIQDEGVSLTQRTNLNFVGPSVTASDDPGNNATLVTISGGQSAWPFDKVYTVGSLGDYATLAAAIAAAPATGTLLMLDAGSHTISNDTLPSGVHLGCMGQGTATLTCTDANTALTAGNGSILFNFALSNTYNDASALTVGISVPYTATLHNLEISGNNAPSEYQYRAIFAEGPTNLYNCESIGGDDESVGLYADGNMITKVMGGYYGGTQADLNAVNNAQIMLYGTKLQHGTTAVLLGKDIKGSVTTDSTGDLSIINGALLELEQLAAKPSVGASTLWKVYPKSTGLFALNPYDTEIKLEPLAAGDGTVLTIQSSEGTNYIAPSKHYHVVSTSGASSKDLDGISSGMEEGDMLILRSEMPGQTVVLKHQNGAGFQSMWFVSESDVSLTSPYMHMPLMLTGSGVWCEIGNL
jgi:hypothetical protein